MSDDTNIDEIIGLWKKTKEAFEIAFDATTGKHMSREGCDHMWDAKDKLNSILYYLNRTKEGIV